MPNSRIGIRHFADRIIIEIPPRLARIRMYLFNFDMENVILRHELVFFLLRPGLIGVFGMDDPGFSQVGADG